MLNKKIIKMNLLKKIKKVVKGGIEAAFEMALKIFAAVANLGQVAKDLKVTVRLQNLVDTKDTSRPLSLLVEKTWLDLLDDKKRCQLDDFPINVQADLTIKIQPAEKGLCIQLESDYLKKEDLKTELGEAFQEFLDAANETIDEILHRDKSLTIDVSLAKKNKTKQVIELKDFFDNNINKALFAVLVKKFVAEVSKK